MRMCIAAVSYGLALVCLAGCASITTVPLANGPVSPLEGKSIVLAARGMPGFAVMSSGKMMAAGLFGAIGGAIAGASSASAGKDLVHNNSIEDPAVAAGKSLLAELAGKHHMKVADSGGATVTGRKPEEIVKAYSSVDYVLDVETVNWAMLYLPMHLSRYGISYATQLHLLDAKTGKEIAASSCIHKPDAANAYSYDEMMANGAEKIKELSKSAAEMCLGELRSKAFGTGV